MLHLHVHSDYSNIRLIDSINKVSKLIQKAVNLNNSGIAITDHESVSGHVQALQIVEKGKSEGSIPEDFKLILGNEIYLVNSLEEVRDNYKSGITKFWHFILLAKDEIGHKQLRILSSLAWDNSFKTGKMERTPTLKSDLEKIVKENPGHLIASTACLGGECSHWILNKDVEKFNEFVQYCYDLFGEDFYFELQPNNSEEQVLVNKTLISISEQLDIPFIVTCDAHYVNKEDRVFHEAYLNSHEEEREVGDFYATTYMMNVTEIHEYLDWQIGEENVNKAIRNTEVIADKVSNYTLAHSTIVPEANIPEYQEEHYFKDFYDTHEYIRKFAYSDNKYDRYLLHLISQGFKTKGYYVGIKDEELKILIDRIEIELSEMWKVTEKIKNSISSYYISTLELIEIMWNEGDSLVGVARGSVTGMYTMYLIGLIQMNPIQWGLPHWRHISHEKAELSDVDIDTQRNRRKQIIEAVKKRKGERKVLNSCTFKTEGSKLAVITAARGLGVDNDVSQKIANLIPITRGFTWTIHDCLYGNEEEERKPVIEFVNEIKQIPNLLETALNIEGLICGRSIHASAVYLFNDDFTEHNARMKAPNGTYITQFNMCDSNYTSGLKMDFLTISSLDIIRHCMELLIEAGHMQWQGTLRDTYNKYLHPDVLDYETKEMWDWIAENKVMDLFQWM
ncbi:PHP domain-containing protein [Blautia hansenii]|uniref:PHP domain-containing protein n=1 Tax=Blautia hansenii TaxID=1322 RepID=UPI0022E17334|nr:PHP domain-containing protein [Blautia hansenii]